MDEMNEVSLLRNGSGYIDLTAYEAIKKADGDDTGDCSEGIESDARAGSHGTEGWYGRRATPEECLKFKKTLGCIKRICELAGYRLEGRIVLVDTNTGKIWK